ncbi:spore germination protein [Caloramator sp. CAR-1]|uniref:spore germination protein n=1 Tax=Caloramator sp. CAR-1 TaxID=3062777 RepID=UPI0026E2B09F|nr:spore germination protein [Caloramator sp. CAR-1]MDO6354929.1 spore germination protein [Caloramator sp. CAR-1]
MFGFFKKEKSQKLSSDIYENMKLIKTIFLNDKTIIFRTYHQDKNTFMLIYSDGMVKTDYINNILESIINVNIKDKITIDFLKNHLPSANIQTSEDFDEVIGCILTGYVVILINDDNRALLIKAKEGNTRNIEEPPSESIIRGPREGFTESLLINLSLIRRRIPHKDLKFLFKSIGKYTKTQICIAYINSIASEKIINEVINRLDDINIDGILDSGYIAELICDNPFCPFQTIGATERPDVACAKLLEGRVIILVDGSPFVLTIPYLFIESFQSCEDYYVNFIFASFNRILRILGFILTTFIPSLYISLVNFHQELLPTPLVLSITAARNGIPFPTVVEAFGMIFLFEILREAGTRLPKPIGQAVSIVGALIIGDAAVTARFVSAPMVIITALTGITEFLIPQLTWAVIIYRFIILLFSSFFGLYGMFFGILIMFIRLLSLKSFGVPYTLHTISIDLQDIKDTSIRGPWWAMKYRPIILGAKNVIRNKSQKPKEKINLE